MSSTVAPLFLIGFPAAGKTTVGMLCASHLQRRFVDLDDVIAASAGSSTASLVAADEAAFRVREAAALRQVITTARSEALVVATGGGAAAYGDNVALMRQAGCVVELATTVQETERRAAGGPKRPLLERPRADIDALFRAREPAYRSAHGAVPTVGRSVAEVADEVVAIHQHWQALPSSTRADSTIVGLGQRSYPVIVSDAPGLDASLVAAHLGGVSRVALVLDSEVARYWQRGLVDELTAAGLDPGTAVFIVPSGEASKSLTMYGQLCDHLIASGLDRKSAIIAIGGGVTGDLAGFVAATLLRGIAIVHVPTTIVAMTDSAIGGKTAIDAAGGKNLVGAFWQPRLVVAPLSMLATLPPRERRAGFGELWKYALLDGEAMWTSVANVSSWAATDEATLPSGLTAVIRRAAAYKSSIVARDELETGNERILLNLGHTVGHAIESVTGMLHGEAVALGLVAAAQVSHALGLCELSLARRIADSIKATGLAHSPADHINDAVIDKLTVDKKRVGNDVRYVALRAVGHATPVSIPVAQLATILRSMTSL